MSKPQVFVSSTYIDLKEVRDSLYTFIGQMGFEANLFEKGGVPFDYDKDTDVSCYDEVRESDLYILIIGGRYGSKASGELKHIRQKMKTYNSITRKEYETALDANLPLHIFVDDAVATEYGTWKRNSYRMDIDYAHVDNPSIFLLLDKIYKSEVSQYARTFKTAKDISDWLRGQWAGLFRKLLVEKRTRIAELHAKRVMKRVNCYKLFYHRRSKGLTVPMLAGQCGILESRYRSYERRIKDQKHGLEVFPYADETDIGLLAIELDVPKSDLLTGNVDDFSYQYLEYYLTYRGKPIKSRREFSRSLFPAKVVVFDFDGTLTTSSSNLNAWEEMWVRSGFSVNECAKYTRLFKQERISHRKWCDITLEKFKEGRLSEAAVKEIAQGISLISDVPEVLLFLKDCGIHLHLLSGSIDVVIREVLGSHESLFSTMKSNSMRFSARGDINEIVGTKYDFEGKSD